MKTLCDVLDKRNYDKLVQEFGGKRIWIPKKGNIGHRDRNYFTIRNHQIKSLNRAGMSVKELVRKFNISRTRIYDIIRGEKFSKSA